MQPHRGTLILVLGVLSFVLCGFLTGIPAWIMGSSDLKKMDSGSMDPSGRTLTNIGKICGMINCILTVIAVVGILAMFALGMMGAGSGGQ